MRGFCCLFREIRKLALVKIKPEELATGIESTYFSWTVPLSSAGHFVCRVKLKFIAVRLNNIKYNATIILEHSVFGSKLHKVRSVSASDACITYSNFQRVDTRLFFR